MLPDIKTLDVDGALQEAEAAVAGDSRASFFRKAALGGAGLVGSGAILGMLPDLAHGKRSAKNDVAVANYALTLEYLEAAFYNQGNKNINFKTPGAAGFSKITGAHENAHVKVLKQTLGSAAVKSPKFDFGKAVRDEDTFLATAFVLENTGVSAYAGQIGNILSIPILKAAASIHSIEARHAAAIAVILDNKPFTDGKNGITPNGAFDKPLSKKAVLKAVGNTGFIKG